MDFLADFRDALRAVTAPALRLLPRLSWSAPWRGPPGEREALSFNGIEHAYGRWLDADPTAVNPLPFEFVLATAERVVVDTYGKHLRT